MLRKIESFAQVDGRKLMDLYREGNEENGARLYPDLDEDLATARVERQFLQFLASKFFTKPGSTCWVWEENGTWVSALRLSALSPGAFYLEALETHPDFRRRGYGTKLLKAVIAELKAQGPFRLRDCVGKRNEASLGVHKKCGFEIAAQNGVNCLSGEINDRCYGMEYVWEGQPE